MKKKQKSPTKNDIVKVLDTVIYEIEIIKTKFDELAWAFNNYIGMKKETEKFNKFIDKKIKQEKEKVESTRNISKDSSPKSVGNVS